MTAASAAICMAAENAEPGSCQPRTAGTTRIWAVDEMGISSVRPCITPRKATLAYPSDTKPVSTPPVNCRPSRTLLRRVPAAAQDAASDGSNANGRINVAVISARLRFRPIEAALAPERPPPAQSLAQALDRGRIEKAERDRAVPPLDRMVELVGLVEPLEVTPPRHVVERPALMDEAVVRDEVEQSVDDLADRDPEQRRPPVTERHQHDRQAGKDDGIEVVAFEQVVVRLVVGSDASPSRYRA